MPRETNAAITFDDAHYMVANEGYEQIEPSMPTGNECMTRAAIEWFLMVDETKFSGFTADQLVPYNLLNPTEWQAVDPYCVQDESWFLLFKTRSTAADWCLHRLMLYNPTIDTTVEARKADGTIISTQSFSGGTGHEHTFNFDLSATTASEEVEIYIKGIPEGAKFLQVYAVNQFSGRYDATVIQNADLTYINIGLIKFDHNYDTSGTDSYAFLQNQSFSLIDGGLQFYGYSMNISSSGASSSELDDLVIGCANQGRSNGVLNISGNAGRTSASDAEWQLLIDRVWTLTQ